MQIIYLDESTFVSITPFSCFYTRYPYLSDSLDLCYYVIKKTRQATRRIFTFINHRSSSGDLISLAIINGSKYTSFFQLISIGTALIVRDLIGFTTLIVWELIKDGKLCWAWAYRVEWSSWIRSKGRAESIVALSSPAELITQVNRKETCWFHDLPNKCWICSQETAEN